MLLKSMRKSAVQPSLDRGAAPGLAVYTSEPMLLSAENRAAFQALTAPRHCEVRGTGAAALALDAEFALALFLPTPELDALADQVLAARRAGRSATLVVATRVGQLAALGRWLEQRALAGRLAGLRLMLEDSAEAVAAALPERLGHPHEDNVLRMPLMPEIENGPVRNLYLFSPSSQALVTRIRGFAENGVTRACLLGPPGSGKTSMAYYYYLVRGLGQFVSVNLMAENTRDKAAIKSLLCGHVSGAFAGASARTGSFTQARDGVCFIDESHDISGPVMEVLMEALDNGQYLPYGASSKRQIECAVMFATNRSWEFLQSSVNLDEFTRLGASLLRVPELAQREEDLIAVAATSLARLAAKCQTWTPPEGLSAEAWTRLRRCPWRGNVRALIRVMESAFVDTAANGGGRLIEATRVDQGLALWEPAVHHSHALYATT